MDDVTLLPSLKQLVRVCLVFDSGGKLRSSLPLRKSKCALQLPHLEEGTSVSLSTDWWLPPPLGWIKVNFDGAFDEITGKASIGGVARDPYGNVLMAFTSEVHAQHPLEAELLAFQRSLFHLFNTPSSSARSSPGIQIEGDCLVLITNIKNSSQLTWDMMPLWKRTMQMLSTLASWTVHHCKRLANPVADMLAHYTIPEDAGEVTRIPLPISEVIAEERTRATSYTTAFFKPTMDEWMGQPSETILPLPGVNQVKTQAAAVGSGPAASLYHDSSYNGFSMAEGRNHH